LKSVTHKRHRIIGFYYKTYKQRPQECFSCMVARLMTIDYSYGLHQRSV